MEILFLLACLLHDCTHAPFSHTLENLYVLRKKGGRSELDNKLNEICGHDKEFKDDFFIDGGAEQKGVGAPHEKMSAYCVMNEYQDAVKKIVGELCSSSETEEVQLDDADMPFIVRMIIGCTYKKSSKINSIKNCIISMLNSSSIDVDGLDYIVRDAYMSGIDNFSIDYRRLLSSFTIIPVDVYTDVVVRSGVCIDGIWLPGSVFNIASLEGQVEGKIVVEDLDDVESRNIVSINKEIKTQGNLYDPKEETLTQFDELLSGNLYLKESCQIKDSVFEGKINGKRLVSKMTQGEISGKKGAEREYILGYAKNSLSIIQSTIEARNHEYMWVYTHPKVLYSSNYLQWELMRDSAKYLCCCENKKKFKDEKLEFKCQNCEYYQSTKKKKALEDYLLYILGYDTFLEKDKKNILSKDFAKIRSKGFVFYRTSDDDLLALFKRIYVENAARGEKKSDKLDHDFHEFFPDSIGSHCGNRSLNMRIL